MKKSISKTMTALYVGLVICLSCEQNDDLDQNTAPVISDQSFTVSEDIEDTESIGKVIATDADDDELTFKIATTSSTSATSDLFLINNDGTLKLKTGKRLDFEQATQHIVSIEVSDGALSNSAKITINVIDVDENEAPSISDQSFDIEENSPLGSTVGTIVASDPDGDDLVYFWSSGQTITKFTLDDNVLKTSTTNDQGILNYEDQSSYVFDVTVGDGLLSTRATITVNIIDVNDAPSFGKDATLTVSAAEDLGDSEEIINLPATDEDGDALTYSLTNDVDNLFEIDPNGRIALQAGKNLDYETKTSHTFTAVVTDPDGAVDEVAVTLNVTDVDDIPLTGIMVSTIAGSTQGYADGTGAAAKFWFPEGLILNSDGELLVADKENQRIRNVALSGEVSTPTTGSLMKNPQDIIADGQGNYYVTDIVKEVILKLSPNSMGTGFNLSVFAGKYGAAGYADGNGTDAQFTNPYGMALAANGDLYVADRDNHCIRKITPDGTVTTYAGTNASGNTDGARLSASFNRPTDLAFDSNNNLIIADYGNHRIRKISPSGVVSTLAGSTAGDQDGNGASAQFNLPYHIAIDQTNSIYVTDYNNRKLKKVTASGVVTTIAGGGYTEIDGDARDASFSAVHGIEIDSNGYELYLTTNKTIRKITLPE